MGGVGGGDVVPCLEFQRRDIQRIHISTKRDRVCGRITQLKHTGGAYLIQFTICQTELPALLGAERDADACKNRSYEDVSRTGIDTEVSTCVDVHVGCMKQQVTVGRSYRINAQTILDSERLGGRWNQQRDVAAVGGDAVLAANICDRAAGAFRDEDISTSAHARSDVDDTREEVCTRSSDSVLGRQFHRAAEGFNRSAAVTKDSAVLSVQGNRAGAVRVTSGVGRSAVDVGIDFDIPGRGCEGDVAIGTGIHLSIDDERATCLDRDVAGRCAHAGDSGHARNRHAIDIVDIDITGNRALCGESIRIDPNGRA